MVPNFTGWLGSVEERAYRIGRECNDEALRELVPDAETAFEILYESAVQEWYNSYSPVFYHRRYSLDDIFDISTDYNSFVMKTIFAEGKMGKDRAGGSLFEKVFVQGWHGGALAGGSTMRSGRVINVSPEGEAVGGDTMRYRMPVGKWFMWGREAVRTPSVLTMFDEHSKEVETEWRDKIAARTMEKIQARQSEIFGRR